MRRPAPLFLALAVGCAGGLSPAEPETAGEGAAGGAATAPTSQSARDRGAPGVDAALPGRDEPTPSPPPRGPTPDATEVPGTSAEVSGTSTEVSGTRQDAAPNGARPVAAVCGAELPTCFDFEDGKVPAGWSVSGPAVVDDTRAFHGTRALHIRTGGKQYASIRGKPPAGPNLYGRFFFYMEAPAPKPHVSFVEATARGPGGSSVWTFGATSERFMVGWIPLPWSGKERGVGSTGGVPIPLGRWTCLEYQFDGSTGDPARVWSDGQLLSLGVAWAVGIDVKSKWGLVDTFESIVIGFSTAHTVPPYELWLDGVALAPARVGCGAR